MVGSVKSYTPNFKFIIPDFNIATWHDYIETNFRNIDAILQQIYVVTNYKGAWETNTIYNKDDVIFIAEDAEGSEYVSNLFQVVHEGGINTTGYANFSAMYEAHPDYYERYLTISDAVTYAEEAMEAAEEATEAASAISSMLENLTANRVVISNSDKELTSSSITSTQLEYLSNVSSDIQTQINETVKTTGDQDIGGNKNYTGTLTSQTPITSDNSTKVATTKFINDWIAANTETAHVVVDSWASGYNYYRVYSDGWIEQGGVKTISTANTFESVTLHKEYANTNYQIMACVSGTSTSTANIKVADYSLNSISSFKLLSSSPSTIIRWRCEGQG